MNVESFFDELSLIKEAAEDIRPKINKAMLKELAKTTIVGAAGMGLGTGAASLLRETGAWRGIAKRLPPKAQKAILAGLPVGFTTASLLGKSLFDRATEMQDQASIEQIKRERAGEQ